MGMEKENLWPYEGFDLQAFNGTMARLWGFIKSMIPMGKGRDVTTVNL